jgi:hypothetical protein
MSAGARGKGVRLKRLRQCEKCPWKASTNPYDIPNGYDVEKHRALVGTVAKDGAIPLAATGLKVMACHEHPPGAEAHCVGWLMNQLGPGNNIGLRIAMLGCEDLRSVRLDGPQHRTFEDTLPHGGSHGR